MTKRLDKVDRVRRLMNEDLRTLATSDSSQLDKVHALRNQEARRRQRPYYSEKDKLNGMNNYIPPNRQTPEQETLTQPSTAHGYPTVQGAYQEFNSYNVTTSPKGIAHTGNTSNFGYSDEAGDRERGIQRFMDVQSYGHMVAPVSGARTVREAKIPEGPVLWLEKNLNANDFRYIGEVVSALVRQAEGQRVNKRVVFERFEQSNDNYSQEQLFMVAHKMHLIKEKYDSTAGQWVVTMPWANPQTPEQLLYNQKGFSQFNYEQLAKKQQGTYSTHNDEVYFTKKAPQMPPATPQNQSGAVEYDSQNRGTSAASLRNPKRGDDFIRNARLTTEQLAYKVDLSEDEFAILKNDIRTLQSQINRLQEEYNKGSVSRHKLNKAEERMRGIKNFAISANARRKEGEEEKMRVAKRAQAVKKTEMRVEQLHRGGGVQQNNRARAEHAYNRHLSLLESANRMLSKAPGYGLNQG